MTSAGRTSNSPEVQFTLPMRALKIKEIRADVTGVVVEVIPDKVIVQGIIAKQVFFVGEDNTVHHFPEEMRFSALVDVPGAMPGMLVQVHPSIFNVIAVLSPDGNRIFQKVIVDVDVVVTDFVQVRVAEDPYGTPVITEAVVGESIEQVLETGTVTLDVLATKVTEIRAAPEITGVTVNPGEVVVSGNILKQIFFVATDGSNRHQGVVAPFSVTAAIPGALPGMNVQVHPDVRDVAFSLDPTGTLVAQEVLLDVFVKVTETVEVVLAMGEGPLIKTERVLGQGSTEVLEETTVILSQPATGLVGITARVDGVRARPIEGKVIIQGAIVKDVTYVTAAGTQATETFTIPFSDFAEVPGARPGLNVFVRPEVRAVVFDPAQTGTNISEKVIVDVFVTVTETVQIPVAIEPYGLLVKVQQVIGEGAAQILVEKIITRVLPITIEFARILVTEIAQTEKQLLLEATIPVPVPAIKVRSVDTVVEGVTARAMGEGVLVEGTVIKQVFFVGTDDIVHHVEETLPFSTLVDCPGLVPGASISASARVENVIVKIVQNGTVFHELVILLVTVSCAREQVYQVVTNVIGPGVTVTRERFLVDVVEDGTVTRRPLDIVTDLTGPRVATVTRQTIPLVRIVDGTIGPVPVSVVTGATFNP
ncbi:MAG: DUF3794 domain-containing protein [Bacteroidota bacterium]